MCVCGFTESRSFLEPNGRRREARDAPFEDPGLASDENGTVNGDYDWYASLGDSRLVIRMCGEKNRGGAGNGRERRPRRDLRGYRLREEERKRKREREEAREGERERVKERG